jgi:hypothetical protein
MPHTPSSPVAPIPEVLPENADSPAASVKQSSDTSNSEQATPMLDIHVPEHSTRTWRDFFIHIATIVIGLLIAIGLEQTVEYVHHRHQLHEARAAIRAELEVNTRLLDKILAATQTAKSAMQKNAAMLLAAAQKDATPTSALDYTWDIPIHARMRGRMPRPAARLTSWPQESEPQQTTSTEMAISRKRLPWHG